MAVKAVLFDIDGTLVDSNDLHVAAWQDVFRDIGATFDDQTVHDQIGKGTDMLIPTLLPDKDEAEQEALGKAHGTAFKNRYIDQVKSFAGARDLLARVHDGGIKVVLASSASGEDLEHYLDLLDVRDMVATSTTSDDVENSKPAPDIFAVALEKLGKTLGEKGETVTASEVIVVGDTPYDVEAARKNGIATIAVRSGKFPDDVLRAAGAVALYDDVAALLADFEASPIIAITETDAEPAPLREDVPGDRYD